MITAHPRPHLAAILVWSLLTTALLTTALMISGAVPRAHAAPAAPTRPDPVTSVTARPGALPGQIRISWVSGGRSTTSFRIDTGLSAFSSTDPDLPRRGRHARSFPVPPEARSIVLTPAQTAEAGAPLGSANHLYLQVTAVNQGSAGAEERSSTALRSSAVAPRLATAPIPLRVGSFNLRAADAADQAPRDWLSRAPYVAKTIMAEHPGLLGLQELTPGPDDAGTSLTRQTESLTDHLAAAGGSRYRLVRTTSYARAGTPTGRQGTRILYDASRYTLLSSCPETTRVNGAAFGFNDACTVPLPLRPGDPATLQRRAAIAQFEDRGSGAQFWFVSAQLDQRVGGSATEKQAYETLRAEQSQTIVAAVARFNSLNLPVIVAADLNSDQNTSTDYAAHSTLFDAGYYDTAAAINRVNFGFATVNGFARRPAPSPSGFGARGDKIMVRGASGANRFENVMITDDPRRPSDHNLVVADFSIPRHR